mmetsp:Transcript_24899/g.83476  ORF Transcript_24899/g.83476 Transcript_24899/m.83476 type:complete len:89 (-) Transcript_24899:1026-1292(-)
MCLGGDRASTRERAEALHVHGQLSDELAAATVRPVLDAEAPAPAPAPLPAPASACSASICLRASSDSLRTRVVACTVKNPDLSRSSAT